MPTFLPIREKRSSFNPVRRLLLGVLVLGILGINPPPALGQGSPKPPEVQRLQAFMDRLRTIEAEFEQQLIKGDAAEARDGRGLFLASRPGKFRWDYTAPYPQLIVSDGRAVWYYEPDLKQVTRSTTTRLDKSPAGFLISGKRLEESFTWEVIPGPTPDRPAVVLTPLQEGSLRWIAITLDPKKEEIRDFVVEDSLNNRSRILFRTWRVNTEIPAERFRFEVPKGVDVIEHVEKNTQ
ncbi:Outer-membrane lipoprotein carrier protein [Candidatus Magnetaquicoccaceae bacterium FCR-1]|uniref:Outer-membrane lipoprotein carrier protein n=1 Tax=Candidatus Magnetaquiglobus chichijimensis TaxID=3141448 RepID=A0ABQ0CB49_9PROT